MGKKLIYLLLAVFLGGFIVLQSCNESPIVPNESYNNLKQVSNYEFQNMESNGFIIPWLYAKFGKYYPVKCDPNPVNIIIWARKSGDPTYYDVGHVEFDVVPGDNSKLDVTLFFKKPTINNPGLLPYVIKKICFHIADQVNGPSGIPKDENGVPLVDSFAYVHPFDSPDYFTGSSWTFRYTLPFPHYGDKERCADYVCSGFVDLCFMGKAEGYASYLPNGVIHYDIDRNYTDGYFEIQFHEDAGFLHTYDPPGPTPPGTFYGYCIDKDKLADVGNNKCGMLYSSYGDSLPPGILGSTGIEFPDNFDLINYLVNHYSIGDQVQGYKNTGSNVYPFNDLAGFSPDGGMQTITVADIQNAIWSLIDDQPASQSWMNPKNPNAVWGMIYAAVSAGEGFIPQCNDKIVTILVPVNCSGNPQWELSQFITFQPAISYFQIPCVTECYNGWADGCFGANFSTYCWGTYHLWNPFCHD